MVRPFVAALVGLGLAACSVEHVDQSAAIAVAERYFGALKIGNVNAALQNFSAPFRASADDWPRLIGLMHQHGGVIVSSELRASSLAAHNDVPCVLLTYAINHQGPNTKTEEKLFVCRSPESKDIWEIAGHEITRLDAQKTIQGGVVPRVKGLP